MTRYWKLNDGSSVESHDDHVDISEYATPISKKEFDDYISSLTPSKPPKDWKNEYKNASTDSERIEVIAKRIGLLEP